jgi:hypothetical protein
MSYQKVNVSFSEEALVKLLQVMDEIDQDLAFTVNLSPTQRQRFSKMGDRSMAFVKKAREYAGSVKEINSPFLTQEQLGGYIDAADRLRRLHQRMSMTVEKIFDTRLLLGAQAFDGALDIYELAKRAAKSGVPGCDSIAEELGKRWKGLRSPRTAADDTDSD